MTDHPETSSPGRSLLFGALGVLLVVLLCLVLLEIGLRVYSAVTPNVDVEFARYATVMKASRPGSAVSFLHAPDTRGTFFGVDVEIDSRGFRDREHGDKPAGATRVALLGDSVTFGWGVAYGDRFSEILEEAWSTEETPVELVNTGHGNYGTQQQAALLGELLADEPLDGVLQVWYINDAEPVPPHRELPWYGRFYTAIFLWSKTDLLRRRFGGGESYVDYYRGLYDEGAPGRAGFDRALSEIGEWTGSRGLPWVFVILPEFHDFASDGPFEDVFRLVKERAEAAGATVVDVRDAFESVDPATVWVARNDVHPNAIGHAVIAEALRERVDPAIFRSSAGEES